MTRMNTKLTSAVETYLAVLRDVLLPKLISGKIRMTDIEKHWDDLL